MVQEKGSYYFARIYSAKGKAIEVFSRSPKIVIPVDSWHKLLDGNRGGEVHFDVFVRTDKREWVRFGTITNEIANDTIDGYLVYRKMHPTYFLMSRHIGVYQRNLENFDESAVLDRGCANCHTFYKNRTDKALIGIRFDDYEPGTLLIENGTVKKIGVKFGYTAWHPSGRLAVYTLNALPLFFHTAGKEARDIVDLYSMLAYFVVDSNEVRTSPNISKKERLENWPVWSVDGRYLYFCSAPLLWTSHEKVVPPEDYNKVKYDLVRISYDIDNDKWGEVETVISARDTGMSIAMPRMSPDGRWLTFCMLEYGFLPTWQDSSDIYMVDMKAAAETGRYEYRRLDINSDKSESWLSWSSNSRWIVFSSNREHGAFRRCYISYVDETGRACKPLIVPQRDPAFYDSCLDTLNTPEFAIGPISIPREKLMRAIRGSDKVSATMPITMATPKNDTVPKGVQVLE
jgi:hypothetical protein